MTGHFDKDVLKAGNVTVEVAHGVAEAVDDGGDLFTRIGSWFGANDETLPATGQESFVDDFFESSPPR